MVDHSLSIEDAQSGFISPINSYCVIHKPVLAQKEP